MIARDRDAGRVDLHEARVGEERAALVAAPPAVTFEFMALVDRYGGPTRRKNCSRWSV